MQENDKELLDFNDSDTGSEAESDDEDDEDDNDKNKDNEDSEDDEKEEKVGNFVDVSLVCNTLNTRV